MGRRPDLIRGMRCLALLPLLACSRPPTGTATARDFPWTPFYWVRASTDSTRFDHAAMLFRLQVRPTGTPSLVQLDLGGSGGMPDGFPSPARDFRGIPPLRQGQLYGLVGSTPGLELMGGGSDSTLLHWRENEIGTVGLPNYLQSALLVDFVNRRLAAIPRPTSLQLVLGPDVVMLELEAGRFDRAVLPLSASNGPVYRALLDTGLSPFPLWTTRAIWEDLTGLSGPGIGTRSYRVSNRRGGMVFIGAPARQALRLGAFELPGPEVVFLASGPVGAKIEEWSSGVDIVLGASVWARGAVLLIDPSRHRLGLARRLP